MTVSVHTDAYSNPEDITPVPEDSEKLQTYIQDRRVIGVSCCYSSVDCLCATFALGNCFCHCGCTLPRWYPRAEVVSNRLCIIGLQSDSFRGAPAWCHEGECIANLDQQVAGSGMGQLSLDCRPRTFPAKTFCSCYERLSTRQTFDWSAIGGYVVHALH